MFCSGRCAPQMAVGRAGGGDVANVGRSRTDGRTSSVCPSVRLSIYRGRRAERVVARGEPSLAREVALTRPPIISVGKCRCGTLHSRRRGKRRSGSLAPRRRRRSCSRRGRERGGTEGESGCWRAGGLPVSLQCLPVSLPRPPSFPLSLLPSHYAAHAATHLSKSEYHKHVATTNDGRTDGRTDV